MFIMAKMADNMRSQTTTMITGWRERLGRSWVNMTVGRTAGCGALRQYLGRNQNLYPGIGAHPVA